MNITTPSSPPRAKRWRSILVVFLAIDLLLLITVLVANRVGAQLVAVDLQTDAFSARQTALPKQLVSLLSSETDVSVTITYPKTMLESESKPVILHYDAVQHIREIPDPLSQNLRDRLDVISDVSPANHDQQLIVRKGEGALLSSAGFDVSPEDKLKKDKDKPTPTEFAWTIHPKNAGDHMLLIDVSDLLLRDSETDKVETYTMVNGQKHPATLNTIQLPVAVYTNLGISQTSYTLTMGLLSLLGCVFAALLAPVLVERYKRRATQPASAASSTAGAAPPPPAPAPPPPATKQSPKKKKKRR